MNVPFLSREGRNELETLLSVFSPLNQTTNPQIMSIEETKFMEKYQPILRRLKAAAQEKGVRDKMTVEDDFLEEMEMLERSYEERMRRLDEKEHDIEERGRSMDDKVRRAEEEKRKVEEEKHKVEEKIHQQQEKAIRVLLDLGMSKREIAKKLGLSAEEIEFY